jgi:hypothetical protein
VPNLLVNVTCYNANGTINYQSPAPSTTDMRGFWSTTNNVPIGTNPVQGATGPDYCTVTYVNLTAAAAAIGCSTTPCSGFSAPTVVTPLLVRHALRALCHAILQHPSCSGTSTPTVMTPLLVHCALHGMHGRLQVVSLIVGNCTGSCPTAPAVPLDKLHMRVAAACSCHG